MSVLGNSQLLMTPEGYQISRSVRLRSSASAYFDRTPASAGNRRTWTWSGWVKRGSLGIRQSIFYCVSGTTDTTFLILGFDSSDRFEASGYNTQFRTSTAVFRDISAWYHCVISFDSTQAIANNRLRIYINNTEITAWATNNAFAQNTDYGINQNTSHRIGGGSYLPIDGYLTEVNFIDGQALTPDSFGEFDAITGVWKPKKFAGTYGTNGFYLNFSDPSAATAAAIGKDYSGNGNNWTPNNISVTAGATYDSMLDVPTPYADGGNGRGNYAVLNPLNSFGSGVVPASGNLQITGNTSAWRSASSTLSMRSGKWYAEFSCSFIASGNGMAPGIVPATINFIGSTSTVYSSGYGYFNDGDTYALGVALASGTTYASNDIIGVAFDADNGRIWFSKNGVWIASGDPATNTNPRYTGITGEWCFAQGSFASAATTAFANFGQRPFAYTPPSGFKALHTGNLPEPAIVDGGEYFNTVLYTGTGSARSVTGVGFQPDFVWTKSRSGAESHRLYDAVRGATQSLYSNLTNAEATEAQSLTAFGSDGFSLGTGAPNSNAVTYAAWNWKANGAGVTNTAGSITSTVSANPTAGFSIVTYTGTGSNATVGHGLGVAPAMVVVKRRNSTGAWPVYHSGLSSPSTGTVYLNTTDARTPSTAIWNSTNPTSSVFSIGGTNTDVNQSTGTYVAYCFAEVPGYSRFGSYTGNGSADGPFVFCGFRPRFVMFKRTDTIGDWVLLDSSRDISNAAANMLFPNLSNAETNVAAIIDFLSNGFKLRFAGGASVNASGGTYIFAAFAENPFKHSLAR